MLNQNYVQEKVPCIQCRVILCVFMIACECLSDFGVWKKIKE